MNVLCCFKPVSFGVTSYASLVTDTRSNRDKQQGLSAPWLEFLLWALRGLGWEAGFLGLASSKKTAVLVAMEQSMSLQHLLSHS